MSRRSGGLNWGRMAGQYRNRQIRLAIARDRTRNNNYRSTSGTVAPDEINGITLFIGIIIFAIILLGIFSSCAG
jgi:hypothetical protein